MAVGLELGSELTYPHPESTASGIQVSMSQTLGAAFTLLSGWILQNVSSLWAFVILVMFLCLGTVVTACVPNKLKRQHAISSTLDSETVRN